MANVTFKTKSFFCPLKAFHGELSPLDYLPELQRLGCQCHWVVHMVQMVQTDSRPGLSVPVTLVGSDGSDRQACVVSASDSGWFRWFRQTGVPVILGGSNQAGCQATVVSTSGRGCFGSDRAGKQLQHFFVMAACTA